MLVVASTTILPKAKLLVKSVYRPAVRLDALLGGRGPWVV